MIDMAGEGLASAVGPGEEEFLREAAGPIAGLNVVMQIGRLRSKRPLMAAYSGFA